MEMKLMPSLRENKRYLLVDAGKDKTEKAILDFIGILGYARAGISFISDKILAVNRKEVDKVRAALAMAGINVRRVSGTLKKLRS